MVNSAHNKQILAHNARLAEKVHGDSKSVSQVTIVQCLREDQVHRSCEGLHEENGEKNY